METFDVEVRKAFCLFPKKAGSGSSGDYLALRDVNFSIAPGEFFCLLGPSGCGKSTVLRMIAGFLPPTSGDVLVRGERIKGPGSDRAVVFQGDGALFNWLSVEENISFGPRMQGVAAERYRRIVAENIRLVLPDAIDAGVIEPLLAEMGLSEWRDAFPGQLSLGMARRAALARALAIAPDLLLMDEPFVSLDDATADRLKALLLEVWKARPTTVLLVTHDLSEALLLADRILLLSASPARILDSVDVPLARDNRDAAALAGLRDDLAARHRRLMASARG